MAQNDVFKALSETKWLTSEEISAIAKINRKRVQTGLRRLLKFGEVECKIIRDGRMRYYYRRLPLR